MCGCLNLCGFVMCGCVGKIGFCNVWVCLWVGL